MENKDRQNRTLQPEGHADKSNREGNDTPREPRARKQDSEKTAPETHMGASEDEVQPTKPPTQELAELTSKKGQASSPEADDFNPRDEITPG
jgi:hypothetical protein